MKSFILLLFILALLSDVYIYRSIICAEFRKLPARIAYILYSVLSGVSGLSIFMLYGPAAEAGSAAVITVMWLIWFFLINALPKILILAGGGVDYLFSTVFRRRIVLFRFLALIMSACVIALMIYGAVCGKKKIRINEFEICSDRVPESFDGYRIVQFSDVHLGTMCRPEKRMERMVEAINGLDADLVVNTGDFVNICYSDLTPAVADILFHIESRDGVWSVPGNHDLGFYIPDTVRLSPRRNGEMLKEILTGMGWPMLSDSSAYIRRGGDSILLTGLGFPTDRRLSARNPGLGGIDMGKAFAGASGREFNVVLSHSPGVWKEVTGRGFGDLMLSGHIHSMQVKFSLFGREWSPAKYLCESWSGMRLEQRDGNKNYLYVNDGIGCVVYPMRIGTPPELTLLILRRCE